MPTGKVLKYNKNRKYNVIRPDNWKTGLIDVLFEEKNNFKIGDRVEYTYKDVNGKRYTESLKKLDT